MTDDQEATIGGVLGEAKEQAAGVADQLKSAAQDLYAQARDSASQVTNAASRSADIAGNIPSSLERALRATIENEPYKAALIAFGIGWIIGRLHRPL